MDGIKLFMAYAPEDKDFKDKLSKHLSALKEKGYLTEFNANEILAGSNTEQELRTMMNQAQIIMLLISSDFIASEDCQRAEDLAFACKVKNEAIVVPVILRPCVYNEGYNQLKILPDNIKPVSDINSWGSEDAALTNVAEGIKRLVESIHHKQKFAPSAQLATATEVPAPARDIALEPAKNNIKPLLYGGGGLLVLALLFWMFAGSNRGGDKLAKVAVPSLTGSTLEEARNTLADNQLFVGEVKEQSTADYPAGTVFRQQPEAGGKTGIGQKVNLMIAAAVASAESTMPSLLGLTYEQALQTLRDNNLSPGEVAKKEMDNKPSGTVIEQQFPPGKKLTANAPVNFSIASAPEKIVIPSLLKKNYADVQKALGDQGLRVVMQGEKLQCGITPGTVIDQKPAAGSSLAPGEVVSLVVAAKPKSVKAAAISGKGDLRTLKSGGKYSQNSWLLAEMNVVVSLEGNQCSTGDVSIIHPLGYSTRFTLRAGEKKAVKKLLGAGAVSIFFSTNDPGTVLKVKAW